MTFGFTRDSMIWWLGIGIALVTYLISVQVEFWNWTYMQWLQFLSATFAVVMAKCKESGLVSSKDKLNA